MPIRFRYLLLFALWPAVAWSQERPLRPARFEHFSIEQGMSSSGVNDMAMDERGFLWIATQFGLNRFDGTGFKVYEHEPYDPGAPVASWVHRIWTDEGGAHWARLYLPGIARFDPQTDQFRQYTSKSDGIGEGDVLALDTDSSGFTWLAHRGSGLSKYDPATDGFTRYVHDPGDPGSLSGDRVTDLLVGTDGTLWVGTVDSGLNRFHTATDSFEHVQPSGSGTCDPAPRHIRDLAEGPDSTLWMTTATGLSRIVSRANGICFDTITLPAIQAVVVVPDRFDPQTAWILTGADGLVRYNDGTGMITDFRLPAGTATPAMPDGNGVQRRVSGIPAEVRVLALHQDVDGRMWIGTDRGLFLSGPGTVELDWFTRSPGVSNSLTHPVISDIVEDPSGILWFGTSGGGINKLNPRLQPLRRAFMEPESSGLMVPSSIWSLLPGEGTALWVGTMGNGLIPFDTETERPFPARQAVSNIFDHAFVSVLAHASGRGLWVGTAEGLYVFDTHDGSVESISLPGPDRLFIRDLVADPDGPLWVGTTTVGVVRLDPDSHEAVAYPCGSGRNAGLRSCEVLSLYRDSMGTLWAGTSGTGLYKYDPTEDRFESYAYSGGKGDEPKSVWTLAEDGKNRFWIGGYSTGLTLLDRSTRQYRNVTRVQGMPSNFVTGILPAGDLLWISTASGLARFDPETESIRSFDQQDGLLNPQYLGKASARLDNGTLAFGGVDGLDFFDPAAVRPNPHSPPVVITAIEITNRDGNVRSVTGPTEVRHLELPHGDNHLSFEFVALDFSNPARNRYSYRLEGLDQDWVDGTPRHFASYANLDPGTYVFRVRAANSDGVWNDAGTSVEIVLHPPFWKTTWFLLVLAGVFAAALLSGHRMRIRAEARRIRDVERARTAEREAVRKKAAKDFHDELGHVATRISLYGEVLRKRGGFDNAEDIEWLDRIVRTAKQLTSGMGDFIWTLDPAKDSLFDVVIRLKDFGDDLFERTGIAFRVSGLHPGWDTVHLMPDWRRHLSLLFKEAMHNALKHARAGNVTLHVTYDAPNLTMTLIDDGCGMPDPEPSGGNGLDNIRARASALSGAVSFESDSDTGTTVRFTGRIP